MDANNAFLDGVLTETIFMTQPPSFNDLSKPNYVCRLRKVIYELKQAPRTWYNTLKSAIIDLAFQPSRADPSIFIYNQDSIICYILVYVDDLVVISNHPHFTTSIIKQLGHKFPLKDMGQFHFFLLVELVPTRDCLFLSQHKYVCDLFTNTNMSGTKHVATPQSTTQPQIRLTPPS